MEKKEFNLKEVFTMWLKKNDKGNQYLSGKTPDGLRLVGFFNGKKKNPKEPDVRIYELNAEGKMSEKELISLWVNVSKNNKKYLSGKIGECRVVGFINSAAEPNGKRPYFSVYESKPQEQEQKSEQPAAAEEPSVMINLPF